MDNPGRLTELVEKSGAKSTDYQNLESAKEFSDKCMSAAGKWATVADRLWKENGNHIIKETGSTLEKTASPCAACGKCSV